MPKSNFICCPVISESSLLLDLQRVKPDYSPGPDGVPGCVLRYCAETLCRPLHKLCTLSFETSDFSHSCKESFVIQLHKKGSKSNVCLRTLLRLICNSVVGPFFPLANTDL